MADRRQGTFAIFTRVAGLERRHEVLTDCLLAVVLAAASLPWASQFAGHNALLWVCNFAIVAPLALRRRWPFPVYLTICAVAFVQWTQGAPLVADVSLLVALFTVGMECPPVLTAAAGLLAEVGAVMAASRFHLTDTWIRSFVGLSGLVAASLLLGVVVRVRREQVAELTERAARAEQERDTQAQVAAAAERARIAREMHDVIAHSLAVMVTMADAASMKLSSDPAKAAGAIGSISEVGRSALAETRRLVGVLKETDGSAELAPQPGLDQLDDLAAQLRGTGLEAVLNVSGQRFEVPPGAQLAVFRLAQEATTNTLKHAASPTRVDISLRYAYPRVRIRVTDDGRGPAPPASSGAGHGLAGMAERVSLYGGRVDAGPAPTGGWAVSAELVVSGGRGAR